MDLWTFFSGMELWKVSVLLALIALGFAVPLRVILFRGGFMRLVSSKGYLIAGAIEEFVFRLGVLSIMMLMFGPLAGIIITTLAYMIYSGFIYGPIFSADAFVIGIFFSFAFLHFGFATVLLAHLFYRIIALAW